MSSNCLFDKQKLETLKTADLSRKGSFDQLIDDFLRHLNTHIDYFTLSSCSGRIVLLTKMGMSRVRESRRQRELRHPGRQTAAGQTCRSGH